MTFQFSTQTMMFKDCFWQINVMQKMKEGYGKTKEPGLVEIIS